MQARSNCLWALAVLQGLTLPAFPVLVKAMVSSMDDWHNLEPVQRHQLYQASIQAPVLLCFASWSRYLCSVTVLASP